MNGPKSKILKILKILKETYPQPGAMELGTPYRTLVGVILSARTRDEQVLKLLPGFFEAFDTVEKLSKGTVREIEKKICTIGMFRQKAKNLKKMAVDVVEKFQGEIPSTMEELISLAGVGRKTASVVLVACFQIPAIAVDTHVHRVTNRLGWVKTRTPEKTELVLLKIIPKKWKPTVNRVFVKFGRYICLPGKPRCWMCPIQKQCPFKQKQSVLPQHHESIRSHIVQQEQNLQTLRDQIISPH